MRSVLFPMIAAAAVFALVVAAPTVASAKFKLEEATIADVHKAFKSGELTAKKLVEMYLKRIEAYDQKGPKLNAVITSTRRPWKRPPHWTRSSRSPAPWDRSTASPSFSRTT